MTIPRPLRIFGNIILIFFAVIGGITALAQLPTLWQPGDSRAIIVKIDDTVLVSRGIFTPLVDFEGRAIEGEQLVESVVTIWRDGGAPITEEMVRRPLEFRMPPGSKVAAVRVVASDSSIPDNFSVEMETDAVTVRWKIFDPDMAFKFAIARFGGTEGVIESQTLGPGVVTTRSRYNVPKTIYYWGVIIIAGLITIVVMHFLTEGGAVSRFANAIDKSIEHWPKVIQVILAILFVVLSFAFAACFIWAMVSVAGWLTSAVVPPIPFA